ncbi:leucine-rich repeat-containing protein 15-like [Lineus longissimus]|uniref:leucine-rich repeat-containing protein 15-like n=1 Tax=Lineus longissimus TaxID=88925 RepID=UPI002B4E0F8B
MKIWQTSAIDFYFRLLFLVAGLNLCRAKSPSSKCDVKYLEKTTILDCRDRGHSQVPQVNDILRRNIDVIDLSHNNIRTLQDGAFARLPPAKSILLENNKIMDVLPGAFAGRENVIETINLSGNNLTCFPVKAVFQLRTLKKLFLSGNKIVYNRQEDTMIAEHDRGLWLEELSLDNNPLGTFYDNGYKFGVDLKMLNIAKTGIRSLPWFVKDLTNLHSLDISGNRIRISKRNENAISQLQRLRILRMGDMKLRQVPRLRLQNLREFYLDHNRIFLLPTGAFQDLNNLQSLSLDKNKFRTISNHAFLGVADTLEKVSLAECTLSEFPSALAGLANLKRLILSDNRLSEIQTSLLKYKQNLEALYLDDNRFEHVPYGIRTLKQLKVLGFSNNEISEIDVNIFYELANLEYLHFQGNQITSMNPVIFTGLNGPMKLDIMSNHVTNLDMCFLSTKVDHLYIHGNPVVCDCALYWLFKGDKIVDDSSRCHGNNKYAGYTFKEMISRVEENESCSEFDKEMYLGYC